MRPLVRRALTIVVAAMAAGVLVASPALTQTDRRPNLVVAASGEPPDFEVAGGEFRLSFTVINSGRSASERPTVTRAFLSDGRRPGGGDDIALGDRTVPELRAGGQATRRVTLQIPAGVPNGTYFLVVCADVTDVVEETDNRNNCYLSGQRVSIGIPRAATGVGPSGPAGPPGAKGPTGPAGDAGADASEGFVRIPRTIVEATETQEVTEELAQVGSVTFRARCDENVTISGNQNDSDNAFIEVASTSGTLSVEGHGEAEPSDDELRAANVPEGTFTPIYQAQRDTDEGFGEDLEGGVSGVSAGRAVITTESGTELVFNGFAGVDLLGAGSPGDDLDDGCIFGGLVTVIP